MPRAQRERVAERHGARRNQPAGAREPPYHVAGVLPHRVQPRGELPQRNHVGRVRGEGEPLRELPPLARLQEGRQGRHPPDEQPRVAAHLLRRAARWVPCRSAQLPLHGGRDQVLPRAGRRRRARVRPRVRGPRGADRGPHPARAHAPLRGRRLPHVRRTLPEPRGVLLEPHAGDPAHGRRRRGDLLLEWHDRLPEGHGAPAPLPHAFLQGGADTARRRRTPSSASRRSTTRARRCTGSAASSWAASPCSSRA